MDLKLPTLRSDHANHWAYGSLVAGFAATAVALGWWIVAVCLDFEVRAAWPVIAVAGVAAVAAAAAAGWLKERNDARVNAAALERGEAAPHGVEFADFRATAWGGCAVGLPVLIVALVLYLAGV